LSEGKFLRSLCPVMSDRGFIRPFQGVNVRLPCSPRETVTFVSSKPCSCSLQQAIESHRFNYSICWDAICLRSTNEFSKSQYAVNWPLLSSAACSAGEPMYFEHYSVFMVNSSECLTAEFIGLLQCHEPLVLNILI